MRFKINISEDEVQEEKVYTSDIRKENKRFPILAIGRDSYVEEAIVESVLDDNLIYNVQVGRHSSIGGDVFMIVDMNHDYRKPCQGRISGIDYKRPENIKRKGEIIVMNDCWIGDKVTIMSGVRIGNGAVVAAGSVVSKDVPDYAIVAGNPARVIGYRFSTDQIKSLQLIRWWNWDKNKVLNAAEDLNGDIDCFIRKYLPPAFEDYEQIEEIDIKKIPKTGEGEEKVFLYIPDFEQDYPTYPQVIRSFVQSYSNTNHELLIYVKEDDLLEDKLEVLDAIFSQFEDVDCYINLYIGTVQDERSLFKQVDAYITNRSLDNVKHMDMADMFGVKTISSVDVPIFNKLESMQKVADNQDNRILEMVRKLANVQNNQNQAIESLQTELQSVAPRLQQIAVNQYAMDKSIDNLKYEVLAIDHDIQYPIIESGEKAIELIIKEGKSMSRFGDGEFAVIKGEDRQRFQHADAKLGQRLKEILQSTNDNVIICLADIYGDLSKYNAECKYNIRAYMSDEVRREHYNMIDMKRTYYDAYVTRPYASYIDNKTDAPKQRFKRLKQIWDKRKLVIIEGEKTRLGVGNDLFDNAESIVRILGPAEHAFGRYDDILREAKKQSKDNLVLIAMGATATVLAYDLACEGYQALDIGHIDIEYEWMLAGKGKKVEVKHKYNNEVANGDVVEEVHDSKYESEIIARCY